MRFTGGSRTELDLYPRSHKIGFCEQRLVSDEKSVHTQLFGILEAQTTDNMDPTRCNDRSPLGANSLPRVRRWPLLAAVACAAFLPACSNPEAPRGNSQLAAVSLTEVLRLGDESAGDTILFSTISHLSANSRGEFFVTESRPAAVSAFGLNGGFLGAVGSEGQGPGEFRYITNAVVGPADSIYVVDFVSNRLMIYDPQDFMFVRDAHIEDDGLKQVSRLIGVAEGGWLMTMGLPPFLESEEGSMFVNENYHSEVRKVSLDGSYGPDVLAIMQHPEMIYNIQENGGLNFVSVPFARHTPHAVGSNNLLYYGWNDSVRISVKSLDGSIQNTISYNHTSVPISSAEWEEARYRENELFQKLVDARDPHKVKPAFQTFVVDEAGRAWVKLNSPEGATDADWLILDRQSVAVGKVSLPLSVDLRVIRKGRAYGVEQQQGGDPMVLVYEIQG